MNVPALLVKLAIACALVAMALVIAIVLALRRRGLTMPAVLRWLYFFRYVAIYRDITRAELGRPALLYYFYLLAVYVTFTLAAVAVLVKLLQMQG
jgi:hypothetical protein